MKAKQERTGEVIRVRCPGCGNIQKFLGYDVVDAYICMGCGEPVEVEEPVQ